MDRLNRQDAKDAKKTEFALAWRSWRVVGFILYLWLLNSDALAKEQTPRRETGPARFEAEIAAFEAYDRKNSVPANPILFVGSSTIRLWQTHDAFPDLPIINRGFGGSTIADVNHFSDRIVFKYKPRLIVFYAGDNDIAAGRTPDRVLGDFQTFVNSVRDRLPGTRTIFLGVKPSIARWKLRPQGQQVNALVKDLARDDELLTYVDTGPSLLGPDGQPRKELFLKDGLHMNAKGYSGWNRFLDAALGPNPSAIRAK
jgi:lysophospholipase L1-like esterase